jgi:hypothetical protein
MIIKYILASRPHNPHYLIKYINFITACQTKNNGYKGYTEQHHICPKADDMFPEFTSFIGNPWNCAKLTPRQHYIAHLMLYKIYNNYTMQVAYELMNSPDYKTRAKGYVSVRDSEGKRYNVDKNDPRYLSGELMPFSKGKVAVRDKDGTTFLIDKTDPRYISGEVVSVNKGQIAVNRSLSEEQIREIRISMLNPTAIITNEYLSKVVSKKDIDKVGKVPIEQLKGKANRSMTYRCLLAEYYANKFAVTRPSMINIIDNKTYKNIVI